MNTTVQEWKKVKDLEIGMKIAVPRSGVFGMFSKTYENMTGPDRDMAETGQEDVLWDEIVSIESVGVEQVFDIEVEGTHNFVAGHLIDSKTGVQLEEKEEKEVLAGNDKDRKIWFGGIYAHNTYISGNVGIGTTSPKSKLAVSGGIGIGTTAPGSLYLSTKAPDGGMIVEGNVGIGTTAPDQALDVIGTIQASNLLGGPSDAVINANGDIIRDPSDVRLKENIQTATGALDKVMQLRGVTYKWKDKKNMGTQTDYGMIAQEVFEVVPELTTTGADGIMGVRYTNAVGLLVNAIQEQQTEISEQDTAIADVNLKTSQNVETVGQLQKSVDENLTVISSNFSAVDTKLALHDSQMANVNNQLTALDTKVSNIDSQIAAVVSEVESQRQSLALGSADSRTLGANIGDLEARLTAAENSLIENEHDLITFEKGTNDTLSSMLDTEDMLTNRVLDHEDRIKALEDKIATMTVAAGGEIPANVVTQDASGNVTLAGIFEAKSVVAGAFSVKNEMADKKTMGDETIANGTGEISVATKAVSETAKVFVTFEGDPGARYWIEKTKDFVTGEFTGFTVKLSDSTKSDVKFSWWIVESK